MDLLFGLATVDKLQGDKAARRLYRGWTGRESATGRNARSIITGYWFLDEVGEWQPPADLASFLADGPPTVYFGFGSMAGDDRRA